MGMFDALNVSATGLTAERLRMDVTAENLANAQTTRGADGQPYRRKEVVLSEVQSGGFGSMLSSSIQSLTDTQNEAAGAAQALATGQATDPTAVVMAVERAQLAMQLASQIRTKAVEAAQDIFHTQV
jgi:flagellar hook-basal body complex protein FliE